MNPESNLSNRALEHPTWKKRTVRRCKVLQPSERERDHFATNLQYVFIEDMVQHIGKEFKFSAEGAPDWWRCQSIGYLWHTSWLEVAE